MIDVVCGLIDNCKGEFLVCLRPQGKHLGGLWEFPGGKVEIGEAHPAALIRELREELSINVEIVQALSPVMWPYEKLTIHLHPYHCRMREGEPPCSRDGGRKASLIIAACAKASRQPSSMKNCSGAPLKISNYCHGHLPMCRFTRSCSHWWELGSPQLDLRTRWEVDMGI